jgi:hypothetical protein
MKHKIEKQFLFKLIKIGAMPWQEDMRLKMGCAICNKDVEFNKNSLFVWINGPIPYPWPAQQYVCSKECADMLILQLM